jgi:hypothetical protein
VNAAPTPNTFLWALRAATVATAVLVGLAISAAGDGRASGAALPGAVIWWVVVAALVVSLVVPGALGLTAVRMLGPLGVIAAAAALVAGADVAIGAAALTAALLTAAVAFAAETGEAMVQGAAYGDERRLPLRMPAAFLLPVALSWLVWCAVVVAAALLLGAHAWVPGGFGAVLAVAAGYALFQRLQRFSRRWLVVVPAGAVLHDHVVLGETLMLPTANVRSCGLALADTKAADLTGPAGGHALEIAVGEMVTPVFAATRTEPKGRAIHAAAFLVAPSRPGRALRALAHVKLPVA